MVVTDGPANPPNTGILEIRMIVSVCMSVFRVASLDMSSASVIPGVETMRSIMVRVVLLEERVLSEGVGGVELSALLAGGNETGSEEAELF